MSAIEPPPARLGPVARRLFAATFIGALGNGLVLPFLVVYLSQVRGMSTVLGGLVIAWTALLGFALTPVGGWFIDRVGPRPVLMVGLGFEAVAAGGWAFVQEPYQAFLVASVASLAGAGLWAASSTFLARVVSEEQRQRAFGISFLMVNLGIGVGGLVAGLVIDVDRAITFEWLYLGDAVFVLLGLVVVASLRGLGFRQVADEPGEDATEEGGYREVLRDRPLLALASVAIVMLTCGYGALEVGYPVFAITEAGMSARLVAFGYVLNTATIVLGQMYVLRLIQGRSRSRIIALVGLIWAAAWVLLGLSVPLSGGSAAVVALMCPLVFGIGETLWQPVVPAIVNDLAPEQLRGRYNAISSLSWNVSGTLGPAFTGLLLGAGLASLWVGLVVAGCLLAGLGGLRLRRVLTPTQDGRLAAGAVEWEDDLVTGTGTAADLRSAIERSGYYPAIVTESLDAALAGEQVHAFLVHHEATFDRDELRRHVTVLVLTATRLVVAHTDDHPADEAHPTPSAVTTTESVPITQLASVLVSRTVNEPARHQPGIGPVEVVLTLGWGVVSRLDLEPASCGDPDCEGDHGYTGTSTADDLSVRVSAVGDGQDGVDQALAFAAAVNAAVVSARG